VPGRRRLAARSAPFNAVTQVAIPELDGLLINVPFLVQETDADRLPEYVADPERVARVADTSVALSRLWLTATCDGFTGRPTKVTAGD
jgi:cobalamin biosynthesis Mg chelatase CobN